MDKARLLARSVKGTTEKALIGDEGDYVVLRGLTAEEMRKAERQANEAKEALKGGRVAGHGSTTAEVEYYALSYGLVEPVLTPDEVAEWLIDAPAGDQIEVNKVMAELSGTMPGSSKSGPPSTGR